MAQTSDPSSSSGAPFTTTTTKTIDMNMSAEGDPAVGAVVVPRITIRYCTQCKWMLRAAYLAQELLSTFSTALGEVALQPATGGIFVIDIFFSSPPDSTTTRTLWDRKADGGFPETKELKRRVRDVIEPHRELGHVDKDYPKPKPSGKSTESTETQPPGPRWPQATPPAQSMDSRSWKTLGPHPNHQERAAGGGGDSGSGSGTHEYRPLMSDSGNMPVVPPASAESNARFQERIDEANHIKQRLEAGKAAAANGKKGAEEADNYECDDCR